MKHTIFILLFASSALQIIAQDCVIPMDVTIIDELPEASYKSLYDKLSKVITMDGVEGGYYSLFTVLASIEEVQEETIAGVRPTYLKVINLNLSIGNKKTGERFNNISIRLTGSGTTEARAYNACFMNLNNSNKDIANMLQNSKNKIMSYYNSQITNIIAESNKLSSQNMFEDALCILASIPTCCNDYAMVQKKLNAVFIKYSEYDCAEKIQKARAIWAANQSEASAIAAGAYLAAVSPTASCNKEAVQLQNEIRARMGEEWELQKHIIKSSISQESERIAAARAIGVAFGQNQKTKTYNNNWIVR